jgi:maltose alpha-D-glucosyltransferase/alpha-amylase
MQLYGRGIRRRLAPMLGGDRRRIELAYALQCTLPGTPVIRYGEEIGMGDDLSLEERLALRTPMQWSDTPGAGFSTAPAEQLIRPVVEDGDFGYPRVNVDAERADERSLLAWFERMFRSLRECPEFGVADWRLLDPGHSHVLAMEYEGSTGHVVALSNLSEEDCEIDLSPELGADTRFVEVFANRRYDHEVAGAKELPLDGLGYRWLRVRR